MSNETMGYSQQNTKCRGLPGASGPVPATSKLQGKDGQEPLTERPDAWLAPARILCHRKIHKMMGELSRSVISYEGIF